MAAKTSKQIRDFLVDLMGDLFPTYNVYDSRIRALDPKKVPCVVIGITSGSEDEDGLETLDVKLQVTHGAKSADYDDADGPEVAIMDRVEADLQVIRNALKQSFVVVSMQTVVIEHDVGRVGNLRWDFDVADDGNNMIAWVNIDVPLTRHVEWTDDVVQDDLDTVYIEDDVTVAATVVESEVTI